MVLFCSLPVCDSIFASETSYLLFVKLPRNLLSNELIFFIQFQADQRVGKICAFQVSPFFARSFLMRVYRGTASALHCRSLLRHFRFLPRDDPFAHSVFSAQAISGCLQPYPGTFRCEPPEEDTNLPQPCQPAPVSSAPPHSSGRAGPALLALALKQMADATLPSSSA